MENLSGLIASVEVLPMVKGLYLFSVRSGQPRRLGDDHELVLPAFRVGTGPGAPSDQVEVMSGPRTEAGWLSGERDQLVLKVKASSTAVILMSVRTPDMKPIEIEIRRLDGVAASQRAPSADTGRRVGDAPRVDGGPRADAVALDAAAAAGAQARLPAADGSPPAERPQIEAPPKPEPRPASPVPAAARRGFSDPATPIEHGSWRRARDHVLRAAAAAPSTLCLLGPPGSGKTFLLNTLALTLRQNGISVTLVRRGDLPFEPTAGAVVLIDEAAHMSDDRLVKSIARKAGLLVLADRPSFADRFAGSTEPPTPLALSPLEPDEVSRFATLWLERFGPPNISATPAAIERLVVRSAGIPGSIVQILAHASAVAKALGGAAIDAALVDDAASARQSEEELRAIDKAASQPRSLPAPAAQALLERKPAVDDGPVPATAPAEPAKSRWRWRGFWSARAGYATAAGSASLALVAMTVAVQGIPKHPGERSPVPEPAPAALPLPATTGPAATGPAATGPGTMGSGTTDAEATPPRAAGGDAKPERSAAAMSAPGGLLLVARPGDTMRSLYKKVYRGTVPPPLAAVEAANPAPITPGAVVVFPAPSGGWAHR